MNRQLLTICCVVPFLMLGCGGGDSLDYGPLGTLSGKVSFEGAPLAEGMIYIEKQGGGGSGGAEIQPDGTYKITDQKGGVPAGTYNVWLVPPSVEVSSGPDSPPATVPKEMPNLPKKYHTSATSGLTVEIKQGANTQDFDLAP